MTKRPHQASQLANYIERRVLELKPTKSQSQIAQEAGFVNAHFVLRTNHQVKLGHSASREFSGEAEVANIAAFKYAGSWY